MSERSPILQRTILIGALLLALSLALLVSVSLLPPPPTAPTPTWPQGIDLPDKLPRLPQ